MSSRCPESSRALVPLVALVLGLGGTPALAQRSELAVCASPDNPPFSQADGAGFENRIAHALADALGTTLRTWWWPQSRGFVRSTLNAGVCDVLIGVPTGMSNVRTTTPYYRSGYVFLVRERAMPGLVSLDDARLADARIALQLPGNDMAATPPALHLAQRGVVATVQGFTPFDRRTSAERVVAAVREGDADVGIAWGPAAGRFARASGLRVVPIEAPAGEPLRFDIAIAVRRDDDALAARIESVLPALRASIDRILDDDDVPRLAASPTLGSAR